MKTVTKKVGSGTPSTPHDMLMAQLGDIGKRRRKRRKEGNRYAFSSSFFSKVATRCGKYRSARLRPHVLESRKQKEAPRAVRRQQKVKPSGRPNTAPRK